MKISQIILSLALSRVSAQYDRSELVAMRDYTKDYRTLSGWECFKAEGKFCHEENHASLAKVTGSSNFGHGVCCKPDFVGEHCNSDTDHKCSQPVAEKDTTPEFIPILTDGKNHQMFAFLPKTNPKTCGISTSSTEDQEGSMKVSALEGKGWSTISLTGDKALKFREGRPEVRAYDSCFYEVQSAVGQYTEEEREVMKFPKNEQRLIRVNFSKLKDMNVFIYGGNDRYNATTPITGTDMNKMVVAGKNYSVPVEQGILIVAYPNENVDNTEFEFNYMVEAGVLDQAPNRMMIAIIIVVIIIVGVAICYIVRHIQMKNKVEVLSTPQPNVPQLQMVDAKADETNEQHQTIEADGGDGHKVLEPLTDAEKGENPRYSQLPEDPEPTAAKPE